MSDKKKRATPSKRASRPNRTPVFIGVGVVVVVAAVLAIVLSGGGEDEKPNPPGVAQIRPVTISGTPLPAYDAAAAPDPAVGTKIPAVIGADFTDRPVRIENDGKAKVLIFVAHWCPHCQREVPILAPNLRDEPLPADTEAFAVSTSVKPNAPNYPPSTWLESVGWPTPVLADSSTDQAAAAFGLSAFPYFVFVNADGTVSSRVSGEIPVEEFRRRIDDLKR